MLLSFLILLNYISYEVPVIKCDANECCVRVDNKLLCAPDGQTISIGKWKLSCSEKGSSKICKLSSKDMTCTWWCEGEDCAGICYDHSI